MSDIKISQLGSTTTLGNSDLIPVSKSLGGGNWESKSISGINLAKALTTPRNLVVALDGVVDANNIKDAVALAVALSPTETNPVTIQVFPGSYVENNPIIIPQWVTIYSEGGQYSAAVIAQNDGAIFIGSGNCLLEGFTIIGQTVGGLPVLTNNSIAYKSTTTTTGQIANCIILNCYTGILSDGGSIVADHITGLSFQRVFNAFMSSINGGFITATVGSLTGIMTSPVYGYYSNGTGSELYMFNCAATNAVNGAYIDNNGYVDAFSSHFEDCTNSIHIGSNGTVEAKFLSGVIEESVTYDLFVESPTAELTYIGSFDSSKFNIASGATLTTSATDKNPLVQGVGMLSAGQMTSWGTLNVGTPGAITLGKDVNVNIGEGRAFVADQYGNLIVEFWSYNATAPSGSKFTRFANNAGTQLTNANDAIIVGCKYQFPAIRLNILTAMQLVNPNDYLVTEYWDGSAWINLAPNNSLGGGGVAAYRRSDYARRNHHIFQNVETQFVECSHELYDNGDWQDDYDVLDQIPPWDANEPFYAIRFRNQQTLASGMTFSNGLVKPHSFVFSSSGQQVNFGVYRTNRTLYVDSAALANTVDRPASFTYIQVSPSISYTDVPLFTKVNANPNNATAMSVAFTMPYDIDTASPLHVYMDGSAVSADSGNIVTTIYLSRVDTNNPPVAFPLTEIEVGPQVTAMPGVANGFSTVTQPIDISGYSAEDILFFTVARTPDDGDDTYNGDFILGDITFKYKGKFV